MRALAIGVFLTGSALSLQAPPVSLEGLTLPGQSQSCRIARVTPPAPPKLVDGKMILNGSTRRAPVPTDLWQGTDRSALAWIWEQAANVPLPDAPPPSSRQRKEAVHRAVEQVESGYIATYEQRYEPDVHVYGLRFMPTAREAIATFSRGFPRAFDRRLVHGATVVVVQGDGPCADAIVRHLESRRFASLAR
jgi:hypothetical protein